MEVRKKESKGGKEGKEGGDKHVCVRERNDKVEDVYWT